MKYKNTTGTSLHAFLILGGALLPAYFLAANVAYLAGPYLFKKIKNYLPLTDETKARLDKFTTLINLYDHKYTKDYTQNRAQEVLNKLKDTDMDMDMESIDTQFLIEFSILTAIYSYDSEGNTVDLINETLDIETSEELNKAYQDYEQASDIKTFLNNTAPEIINKISKVIDAVAPIMERDGIPINFTLLNDSSDRTFLALKSSYKLSEQERSLIENAIEKCEQGNGLLRKTIGSTKFLVSSLLLQNSNEWIGKGNIEQVLKAKKGEPYLDVHPDPYVIERLLADNDRAGQDLVVKYLNALAPALSPNAKTAYQNFITIRDEQELLEKTLVKPVTSIYTKSAKEKVNKV